METLLQKAGHSADPLTEKGAQEVLGLPITPLLTLTVLSDKEH